MSVFFLAFIKLKIYNVQFFRRRIEGLAVVENDSDWTDTDGDDVDYNDDDIYKANKKTSIRRGLDVLTNPTE